MLLITHDFLLVVYNSKPALSCTISNMLQSVYELQAICQLVTLTSSSIHVSQYTLSIGTKEVYRMIIWTDH